METVLFYIFAALAVIGAMAVVSNTNPVTGVVSLVLTLFPTAVLFVLLIAHFIAVIQVLIYAGAIMVLFLFTVMFLNLRPEGLVFDVGRFYEKLGVLIILMIVTGAFSMEFFSNSIGSANGGTQLPEEFGTVEGVSRLLFTRYLLPFELTSILIIVAILGVVAIAKRRV